MYQGNNSICCLCDGQKYGRGQFITVYLESFQEVLENFYTVSVFFISLTCCIHFSRRASVDSPALRRDITSSHLFKRGIEPAKFVWTIRRLIQ